MPSLTEPPRWFSRLLPAIVALLLCYQAYYGLKLQKIPSLDASMGFLVLQSSLQHGEFNTLRHPAPAELARDQDEFVVWWTPGQYLIPYWCARALGDGTNLDRAFRMLSLLCSVGGLGGCYVLYRRLGFSPLVGWLSLIVLCTQQYFLKFGRVYLAGDQLMFCAAPWLALAVLAGRASVIRRALLATMICFVALFLKATVLAVFCSLLLYLAFELLGWPAAGQKRNLDWRPWLVLGVVFCGYVAASQLVFMSRGVSIGATGQPWAAINAGRLWGIPLSFAGPLYGAFSRLEAYSAVNYFIPLALLSLLALWGIAVGLKSAGLDAYRRLLLATYLGFAVFFAYAFARGLFISQEPRHFRFVGLIFIPGLVHLLVNRRYSLPLAGVVLALSLVSFAGYHRDALAAPPAPESASRWGIRQPVSNASLAALHHVDDTYVGPETVVLNGFDVCPALLLEFNHGRRLQDGNWAYFGFNFGGRELTPRPWYHGRLDSIVVIVSKNNPWFFGPSLPEIAQTFERPLQLTAIFENEELVIYRGGVR